MILPLFNKAAETRTKTRQDHYQQNHFGIGFTDRKDDDASNDLLLRIAAGAAHAERTRWLNMMITERTKILQRLVDYREPVEPLLQDLRKFGWDSNQELFILSSTHIDAILERYLNGELTAEEVTRWAECFEARDDVGFECANLQEVVFRLANTEINDPITLNLATRLRKEMKK
jgi:hypothetical protein